MIKMAISYHLRWTKERIFDSEGNYKEGISPYKDGFYDNNGNWHPDGAEGYYDKQGTFHGKMVENLL